jgi:hypothetical protein
LDLGFRSFGRGTRPDKDEGRSNAAAERASEKIRAAARNRRLFDAGGDCRGHSNSGPVEYDARSQRNLNASADDCDFANTESCGFGFTDDASSAEHTSSTKSVADCCLDRVINSAANGFNHAENAPFALDSSADHADAIAYRVRDDDNAAGDSSKNVAAGIDNAGADENAFRDDGLFG